MLGEAVAIDTGGESGIWDKCIGLSCGKEFLGIGRRRELDFKIKGRTDIRVRRERKFSERESMRFRVKRRDSWNIPR